MNGAGPHAAVPPVPQRAYWFPLTVFGVLIAVSVPLYAAGKPVGWFAYSPLTGTVLAGPRSEITFGGPGSGLAGIPEGWYWAAALTAGFLLTAAWYARPARRTAAPGRGYLLTGLALTALVALLPLLAWNIPLRDWLWLVLQWSRGTFALLVIAAGLWLLARRVRSRALWLTAAAYTAAALAADWPPVQRAGSALALRVLGVLGWHPLFADGAVLLPALALLAAAALILARRAPRDSRMEQP